MEAKNCLNCGNVFEGRNNKVYCSARCKSAINNQRIAERDKTARHMEQKIRNNRRILKMLYDLYGTRELAEFIVKETQFDFRYSNGLKVNQNFMLVLDYKLQWLENKNFIISKIA